MLSQLQLLLVATSVLTQRGCPSLNETTVDYQPGTPFYSIHRGEGRGTRERTQVVQACDGTMHRGI